MGSFRCYSRVSVPFILSGLVVQFWPHRFKDADDAHVDRDQLTMMYGMGLIGVIVVVLAVLASLHACNTLCEVARYQETNDASGSRQPGVGWQGRDPERADPRTHPAAFSNCRTRSVVRLDATTLDLPIVGRRTIVPNCTLAARPKSG